MKHPEEHVRLEATRVNRDKAVFEDYISTITRLQTGDQWLDYPFGTSIETFVKCNARCHFCPYPGLERQGDKMSEALFEKIVAELAEPYPHGPLWMTLARVNEPLLDRRYFDFCRTVNALLPGTDLIHFSNGTTLSDGNVDKLLRLKNNWFLNVSLNDHRKSHHEEVMGISYDLVMRNLRRLHQRKVAGEIGFEVEITRPGNGSTVDIQFIEWVDQEFPGFRPSVLKRFDWIGRVEIEVDPSVPNLGCQQWYELHFLADGREAFCCIDSDGRHGNGDANTENVLDIYNRPSRRELRLNRAGRLASPVCSGCSALL